MITRYGILPTQILIIPPPFFVWQHPRIYTKNARVLAAHPASKTQTQKKLGNFPTAFSYSSSRCGSRRRRASLTVEWPISLLTAAKSAPLAHGRGIEIPQAYIRTFTEIPAQAHALLKPPGIVLTGLQQLDENPDVSCNSRKRSRKAGALAPSEFYSVMVA